MRTRRLNIVFVTVLMVMVSLAGTGAQAAKPGNGGGGGGGSTAVDGTPCSTAGTWVEGELNVYFFDVEQGDAQLVVGPTGRTMLIDLGENAWNAQNDTNAMRIADEIRAICAVAGRVHLDYVMSSHIHLDHIGYAGNPHDTSNYGNGIYQLLHPDVEDFSVGQLITRDVGTWSDSNGDGDCEVGTNAEPSADVVYHHAGTTSSTARRWICWVYGPSGQYDRTNIEGKVLTLTNEDPWPSFDLGTGVEAVVLQANAKGVMQSDGVTPVSGDHVDEPTPPSENDYSIAIRFRYGDYEYATAGDTDGEYSTSSFGYTYNDVEASVADAFGDVETMRVNHHGSSHSSNHAYVTTLAPETAVISCGNNSYGHPANRVLDELRAVPNADGVGADIYLTNNPCDLDEADGTPIDYSGTLNANGDIWLHTTGGGTGYDVAYDAGTRSYGAQPPGGGDPDPGTGDPADVVLNEYVPDNATFATEWVELFNPTSVDIDVSGLWVDDIEGGSSPVEIPSGTVIAAGGYHVVTWSSFRLNNTGDDVRLLSADQSTVYDSHTYTTSADDLSYRRSPDGGSWCPDDGPATQGTANPATC
ncbi:MAG: lamin tail domain-containing protein [Nitriliruptorales bacterium]